MIYKVFGALDKTDVSQSVGDPVESPKGRKSGPRSR